MAHSGGEEHEVSDTMKQELKSRAIAEWNRRCIKMIDWAEESGLNLLDQGKDTESLVGIDLAIELFRSREDVAALQRANEALVSLHFICPFTGLKFAFHRQDQVDMLQKHYEFFAAKDDALIRQNKALVGALKEYRSLHDGCLIIPENGYDRRCRECKDADAALAGQDAASEKGEPR